MINIDELKARVNIVDIIENFVPLKKAGKDYQACCPFHNERTPSFTVIEKDQYYYCFGCSASGNVIDFLIDINGWDFKQAAKYLGADIKDTEMVTGQPVKARPSRARLGFDCTPFDASEITEFLKTCECKTHQGEQIFFKGSSQIAIVTDINANPVSLMQIIGQGFKPKPYKKSFLYGSCAIFGELTGDVYLCENWYEANKLNRVEGKNTVCYFDPHNLYFMQDELKRKQGVKIIVIAETEESLYQADKFNLLDCYMGGIKVDLDLIYEGKELCMN